MSSSGGQAPRWHERGSLLLVVVAAVVGISVVGGLTLLSLNWLLRSEPFWSWPTPPTQADRPPLIEILKVTLTIVAGIGGVVALTVAYRRQKWLEDDRAGRREDQKALLDRFGAATAQLGHENPTVRLAGVYALANLADEWPEQRQQCVDVLCAHLRLPWDPKAGQDPDHPLATGSVTRPVSRREGGGTRTWTYPNQVGEIEVRRTILRVIADHLRGGRPGLDNSPSLPGRWSGLALDFTGATLPDLDFSSAVLPTFTSFDGATFCASALFDLAVFSGRARFHSVNFVEAARFNNVAFQNDASFLGSTFQMEALFEGLMATRDVYLSRAQFFGCARFDGATFTGTAEFNESVFHSESSFSRTSFADADFARTTFQDVSFYHTDFSCSARFIQVQFGDALFDQAKIAVARFDGSRFSEYSSFERTTFSEAAHFGGTEFSGSARFDNAEFFGETAFVAVRFTQELWFEKSVFHGAAMFDKSTFSGNVSFEEANFMHRASFGCVRFSKDAWFAQVKFQGDVVFDSVTFAGAAHFSTTSLPPAQLPIGMSLEPPDGAIYFDGRLFQRKVDGD